MGGSSMVPVASCAMLCFLAASGGLNELSALGEISLLQLPQLTSQSISADGTNTPETELAG